MVLISINDLFGKYYWAPCRTSMDGNYLFTSDEWFFDFNEDGSFTTASNLYNGPLCNDETETLCTKELVDVRAGIIKGVRIGLSKT